MKLLGLGARYTLNFVAIASCLLETLDQYIFALIACKHFFSHSSVVDVIEWFLFLELCKKFCWKISFKKWHLMFGSAIKHVVKWRFKSKFPSWYGRLDTGILEKFGFPPPNIRLERMIQFLFERISLIILYGWEKSLLLINVKPVYV